MTRNNFKKNTISGLMLSVAAILSMAVIIPAINSVSAQESYFEQALVVFEEIKTFESEIEQHQIDLVSKSSAFANTENGKILQNMIDQKTSHVDRLNKELDRLEVLNKALYVVDDATREKLRTAEKVIYDEYFGSNAIDKDQLVTASAYFKDRTLDVVVNSLVISELGITEQEITDRITSLVNNSVDDVPITIRFVELQNISHTCSSKTADCTSMIGGIAATGDTEDSINTIGYKAKKGSTVGFVMAAHSVSDLDDEDVRQSHTSTRVVGTVDEISTGSGCDCAWVDANLSVYDDVWKNSSSNYDIAAKIDGQFQAEGTWVYKVGAQSGITLGELTKNPSGTGVRSTVEMYSETGDSGAPVFTKSGDNITIFGMLVSNDGETPVVESYFHEQDHIEDVLGITTSTS